MVFLNGVHFGHIQTEMLLIHISRTFLESLGIGKWPFFDDHDVIILVFVICSYDEWKTKHNLIPESHDERSNSKHDRY